MGFKNMFKKSSKLFDREGFYIILFVCLCIVAVAAVYISRNNLNPSRKITDNNKKLEEPTDHKDLVDSEEKNKTTPTIKQPEKNTSSTSTDNKNTSSKSDPAKASLKLIMPIEGEILKVFDKNKLVESKTMNQYETHEGIDIACDIGTEVKAAQAGKVVDVHNDDRLSTILKTGMGMTVVIEHKNGIRTVYCNLAENVNVKVGDNVTKGQVIGVVGDTAVREAAAIEGSHLHFAVLKKSGKQFVTVNPKEYLK